MTLEFLTLSLLFICYSCIGWVITLSFIPVYIYPLALGLLLCSQRIFDNLIAGLIPSALKFFSLFCAWSLVTVIFSEFKDKAFIGSLNWLAGLFLVAVSYFTISNFKTFMTFMVVFVSVHFVGLLLGISQIMYGYPYYSESVYPGGASGFEGMNFLFGKNYIPLVSLGMGALIAQSGLAERIIGKKTSIAFLMVGLIGVGISNSRSTQIGIVVSMICIFIAYRRLLSLLAVISLSTATFFLLSGNKWSLLMDGDELRLTESDSARFYLWASAWNMIKDNPIVGVGDNNFKLRLFDYTPEEWRGDIPYLISQGIVVDPHNVVLGVMAQNGLVGFFLFASFYFLTIRSSYLDTKSTSPELRILGACIFVYLVAYFVDMNFHNYFNDNNIWLIIGAYFGARRGLEKRDNEGIAEKALAL
jgi:O-antigen ligase